MTAEILGTLYTIETRKISEDPILKEGPRYGCCLEMSKRILIADTSEQEYFSLYTEQEQKAFWKQTARHEIIHAFLNESGLSIGASAPDFSWAKNEEMVDWLAIQSPKIFQVFQDLDLL